MSSEPHSEAELRLARPAEIVRMLARAVTLRCPHCGGRPVIVHWFRLRDSCLNCGLRLERGEHDYFTGSMLFNFIVSELLFAAIFIGYVIAAWPEVNWDVAQWVLVVMIAAAPVVMYPVSKLLWLSFDMILRPVTAAELEWHRSARSKYSTD